MCTSSPRPTPVPEEPLDDPIEPLTPADLRIATARDSQRARRNRDLSTLRIPTGAAPINAPGSTGVNLL